MTEGFEPKMYIVWYSYKTNEKPEDNPRLYEFHAGMGKTDAELNFASRHNDDIRFIENINVQEVELKTEGYNLKLEKIVESRDGMHG